VGRKVFFLFVSFFHELEFPFFLGFGFFGEFCEIHEIHRFGVLSVNQSLGDEEILLYIVCFTYYPYYY